MSFSAFTVGTGGGGTGVALEIAVNQVGHGLSVGQVIQVIGTNTFGPAQANNAANSEAVGMVSNVVDADNFLYICSAIQVSGAMVPVGAPGDAVFLSPSVAGGLTTTKPTSAGQVIRGLGTIIASGATMYFDIAALAEEISSSGGGNFSLLSQFFAVAKHNTAGGGSGLIPSGTVMIDDTTNRIFVAADGDLTDTVMRVFKNTYGSFEQEYELAIDAADLTQPTPDQIDDTHWCKDDNYIYCIVRYRDLAGSPYTAIDVLRWDFDGTNLVAYNIYLGAGGSDSTEPGWTSGGPNNFGCCIVGSSLFTLWETDALVKEFREYTISGATYTLANTYAQIGSIAVENSKNLIFDSFTNEFILYGGDNGSSGNQSLQNWEISGTDFTNTTSSYSYDDKGVIYTALNDETDAQYLLCLIRSISATSIDFFVLHEMEIPEGGSGSERATSYWLQELIYTKI